MEDMTLYINPNNRDLAFDEGGNFKKIEDTDVVIQSVRHVLTTWKGEFFSDETFGTDYDKIVGKNQNDIYDGEIEEAIREAVFQVDEVSRIDDISFEYENRKLTISVQAVLDNEEKISVEVTV